MIRLSGLFDVSLGGFPCIRGYAKLGDLARCSKPDEGYQRDLLSDHRGEIKNFLSDRDNLFFPEIILSCKLQYDFTKPGAISGLNPIRDILNKEKFRSNIDGISIAFRKDANLATLTINEMMDKTPLNRVDGNHRLSAVELNKDFEEYNTPFCILLLSDDPSGEQKDKIIFHNINFKAVPLEEELSLKIILEDSKLFPDDILKKPNLGWEYYLTRKILEHESILEDISVLKKQKYRTLLKSSIKILLDRKGVPKKDTSVKHILDVLKSLDFLCKSKPYLGRNSSIFSALICVHTENPTLVNSFVSWIEGTHMYDLQKLSVESLLEIFYNMIKIRKRKIFISLNINNPKCEEHYKTIESVVKTINEDFFEKEPELKLLAIRIDKSSDPCTFQIVDKIQEEIENCGLFIADLTSKNPNVYHEAVYAMGYIKGKNLCNKIIFLLRNETPKLDDVAFNLRNFSQIRFCDVKELEKEITSKIKGVYDLTK